MVIPLGITGHTMDDSDPRKSVLSRLGRSDPRKRQGVPDMSDGSWASGSLLGSVSEKLDKRAEPKRRPKEVDEKPREPQSAPMPEPVPGESLKPISFKAYPTEWKNFKAACDRANTTPGRKVRELLAGFVAANSSKVQETPPEYKTGL